MLTAAPACDMLAGLFSHLQARGLCGTFRSVLWHGHSFERHCMDSNHLSTWYSVQGLLYACDNCNKVIGGVPV